MAFFQEGGAPSSNGSGNGFLAVGSDAGSDAAYYEQVKNFVRGWGIDGPNTVDFMLCTQEAQKRIMEEFRPGPDTRNMNALFCRFVRNLVGGEASTAPVDASDPQRSFVQRWGLDDGCVKVLSDLPPHEQEEVMSTFAPGEEIRNRSAFFMRFVRNRHLPQPLAQSDPNDPLAAFVAKWGLDDTAIRCLYELPLDTQVDVLDTFNPGGEIRNVSALFMKYVRTRQESSTRASQQFQPQPTGASDKVQQMSIESFAQMWGLDPQATECLSQMPLALQEDIMAGFQPRPDARNMSALFMSFVKARSKERGLGDPVRSSIPDLSGFVAQFGLDERAQKHLHDLTWDRQQEVIAGFKPPPDTQNVSAMFIKFAGTRKLRSASGPAEQFPVGGSRFFPAGAGVDRVDEFVRHWQLDQGAMVMLRELPEYVRADVMSSFNPGANTRNISALFHSFVKQQQKRKGPDMDMYPFKRARVM